MLTKSNKIKAAINTIKTTKHHANNLKQNVYNNTQTKRTQQVTPKQLINNNKTQQPKPNKPQ